MRALRRRRATTCATATYPYELASRYIHSLLRKLKQNVFDKTVNYGLGYKILICTRNLIECAS